MSYQMSENRARLLALMHPLRRGNEVYRVSWVRSKAGDLDIWDRIESAHIWNHTRRPFSPWELSGGKMQKTEEK